MPDFGNLLVLTVIALLAPLLLGLAPRLRTPSVVLEIVAGVVVGPSVLGLVTMDQAVQVVSLLGLAFLLFLAGLEVDLHRLRGSLLRVASIGYVVSLAIGVAAGSSFGAAGWVRDPMLIAVALSATSLGLVVPVLKDAGRAEHAMGQTTITASSVADFAAVVLLSLLFSVSGGTVGGRLVSLLVFVAFVVVTGIAVTLAGRSMRMGDLLLRLQDTTAEIRVRAAVVLLVAFVVLAEGFGLESILGAFLAGAVVSFVDRDSVTHPHFRTKLEAIGYGFLIPVFFVASGVQLDLGGLIATPSAWLRVPLFLVALLLVRGLPALLYQRSLGTRSSVAAGLLQATSLPFLVAATQIGVALGLMAPETEAALICAGLLSVLLFPTAALALLRKPAPGDPRGDAAEAT
ncbi:cation:proton antiporter [Saccharopolyspora rhizosphaerae]|uniref:Cation:proton antiporter n=1 Tax=Saccharopolyspora rhizosphaerae TaxID=2492662 RepID=A0A3R8Q8W2_9PSEU|nr:cation:proton antiporter [Saccharopolyspora rhizosphaerae]RRO15659.1 cation:proton antiporter [Saccharopolyspora rhizosphaerae]